MRAVPTSTTHKYHLENITTHDELLKEFKHSDYTVEELVNEGDDFSVDNKYKDTIWSSLLAVTRLHYYRQPHEYEESDSKFIDVYIYKGKPIAWGYIWS